MGLLLHSSCLVLCVSCCMSRVVRLVMCVAIVVCLLSRGKLKLALYFSPSHELGDWSAAYTHGKSTHGKSTHGKSTHGKSTHGKSTHGKSTQTSCNEPQGKLTGYIFR